MPRKILFGVLSVVFFLSFIFFSYLVAKGHFVHIDFDTTVKFQDHIPHKFDLPFSLLSLLGTAEITGLIWVGVFIFLLIKRFWLTACALFLMPIALLMEIFGKVFVFHPAPPHLLYRGLINFNLPSEYVPVQYSYPSGHMIRTSFLVMFFVGYLLLRRKNSSFLVLIPLLVGLMGAMMVSRVYLGEHWFSDVIGGTLLGTSFGLLAAVTVPIKKLHSKEKLEQAT